MSLLILDENDFRFKMNPFTSPPVGKQLEKLQPSPNSDVLHTLTAHRSTQRHSPRCVTKGSAS